MHAVLQPDHTSTGGQDNERRGGWRMIPHWLVDLETLLLQSKLT